MPEALQDNLTGRLEHNRSFAESYLAFLKSLISEPTVMGQPNGGEGDEHSTFLKMAEHLFDEELSRNAASASKVTTDDRDAPAAADLLKYVIGLNSWVRDKDLSTIESFRDGVSLMEVNKPGLFVLQLTKGLAREVNEIMRSTHGYGSFIQSTDPSRRNPEVILWSGRVGNGNDEKLLLHELNHQFGENVRRAMLRGCGIEKTNLSPFCYFIDEIIGYTIQEVRTPLSGVPISFAPKFELINAEEYRDRKHLTVLEFINLVMDLAIRFFGCSRTDFIYEVMFASNLDDLTNRFASLFDWSSIDELELKQAIYIDTLNAWIEDQEESEFGASVIADKAGFLLFCEKMGISYSDDDFSEIFETLPKELKSKFGEYENLALDFEDLALGLS